MRKYDFDPELEQLLSSMKDHPALGGDFDFQKSWKNVADKCGFEADTSGMTHSWRDWLEFSIWDFTHQMVQPMAAVALSVFLFVGGWVGVVNASVGALPGDRLYPVKLGIERAQMALATSSAQKAQLRTEFTSRRLEEMVALAASGKQNDTQLASAVDRVKKDVANLKTDLANENETQATELAKAVGRKAEVYKSTVNASSVGLSSDMQEKVQEVQTIIDETKDQAVDVMVTTHEKVVTAENTRELEVAFEKAYAHASTIATKEEQAKLAAAKALKEKGNFRRAFQALKEIELAYVAPPGAKE